MIPEFFPQYLQKDNKLIPHPLLQGMGKRVGVVYYLSDYITQDDKRFSGRAFLPKNRRTCLFCGRKMPETTFKTAAHIISENMGNSNLFSDFECDQCNQDFSVFEGDLSQFLGISRTFSSNTKSNKAPKFKNNSITAQQHKFNGEVITVVDKIKEISPRGTSGMTVGYQKNSYIPLNVYKALLKFSLSFLGPKRVLARYPQYIDFLMGKAEPSFLAEVGLYQFSFTVNSPMIIYLFHIRQYVSYLPEYIVGIQFQNYLIYLPIHNFNSSKALMPLLWPPPYINNFKDLLYETPYLQSINLSSSKRMENEKETFNLTMDPEVLESLVGWDPKTGKQSKMPFNPREIVKIIISSGNFKLQDDQLGEFSKLGGS